MSDDEQLLDELEALSELDSDDSQAVDAQAEQQQQTAQKAAAKARKSAPAVVNTSVPKGAIALINPLEGEGDLNEILNFDDLDIALKGQAASFAYFSVAAAKAQIQFNKAKQNLEQIEAKVSYRLRADWDVAKDGKITEKALDAKVKLSTMFVNAQECQNDAQYINKLCSSVVEAFHQREQMIIQTCKRTEMEMMMTGSYKGRFSSNEERDEFIKKSMKKSS